ncbi:MAG: hypothetical protein JXA53_01635 [Bacteroidales bacterium]|nr:hypothetical protein [Bacteroidales bacterium]
MKTIENSIHSKSSTRKLNRTAGNIITAIKAEANPEFVADAYLSELTEKALVRNGMLTESLNEQRANSIFIPLDAKRDNQVRAFWLILDSKLLSINKEEKDNAEIVAHAIGAYNRNFIYKSYSEESADLDAMIADCEKPEVLQAITKCGDLLNAFNNIKAVRQEWNQAVQDNAVNNVDLSDMPSATSLHPMVLQLINNELLSYLEVMSRVKPDVYGSVYKIITEFVKSNNDSVRNHLRRLKAGEIVEEDLN